MKSVVDIADKSLVFSLIISEWNVMRGDSVRIEVHDIILLAIFEILYVFTFTWDWFFLLAIFLHIISYDLAIIVSALLWTWHSNSAF